MDANSPTVSKSSEDVDNEILFRMNRMNRTLDHLRDHLRVGQSTPSAPSSNPIREVRMLGERIDFLQRELTAILDEEEELEVLQHQAEEWRAQTRAQRAARLGDREDSL